MLHAAKSSPFIRNFAVVAVLAFLALPLLLAGQENLGRGRVTGQVVDESGAPIEGVAILVQKTQSTTKLNGMTDKKGRFAVAGLGSGRWRISASKAGYADAFADMNIAQLASNPPVALTLKKLEGVQALRAEKSQLAMIDAGNDLMKQGNYDGAISLFQDFLKKYPDIYPVRLNIATAYMNKGDLAAAESEFKAVLEKTQQAEGDYSKDKPTAMRALSGLGELALKKGDLEASRKYLTQALAISPEDEAAAYNVGEMLFSNQNVDEAIKYFELAIQIKKDWSKPYYRLGFVYLNKGDYAKSLEYFNKFVALDPQNPETPNVKNMIATIEKMKK